MSGVGWRPLHRRLADEAIALMDQQRAEGLKPRPVHLMLVNDETGRGRTGCDRGLGEWVTGDVTQVDCAGCLEVIHA